MPKTSLARFTSLSALLVALLMGGLLLHDFRLIDGDAIGKDAYGGVDLFEGTTPAAAQRSPELASPLGDVDSDDPGVDISGIVALGGKNWKAFMG